MQSKKDIAVSFEKMIVAGQITEAFEKYVSPNFRHHNPYFKGDRESLLKGMEENAEQFKDKKYEIKQSLEEHDLVITHAKLQLNLDMPEISVVHIYRFEQDKIVEEWDLSMTAPKNCPNENGLF
jgi:predicted SnoaL-like aldol condensation-catalyzing enzyme